MQAYFSGHEHDLQYHHLAGEATHYIISGAGSLTDYPLTYRESPRSQYLHQGSGAAQIGGQVLLVKPHPSSEQ